MKFESFLKRYLRYLLFCVICSAITIFINSEMSVNRFRLQLVSTALYFLIVITDSYIFAQYFGKFKHISFGMLYPYTLFAFTSYLCHFVIKSSRWKYLFLPLDLFESFGMSRILSVTLVHILLLAAASVFVFFGRIKFYKKC